MSAPSAPAVESSPAPADLLAVAARLSGEGVAFALITVVRATRPTSGKPGDKAILTERGEWLGWVGGFCAEPTARRAAAQALRDGECRLIHLTNDETEFVRPGVEVVAMTCHSGGSLEIYVEPHLSEPVLVVFGRSPIARSLCELGELLEFRVVPVDLQAGQGLAALGALPRGRRAVVVASHGHAEVEALAWALEGDASAYVGLVTSQRRREDVFARLREQGLGELQLGRVFAPAGLSIGATRPKEVALSILSQIVAERKVPKPTSEVTGAVEAQPPVASSKPEPMVRAHRRSCCDVDEVDEAPALRCSAVVLAAGLSRRMGAQNKLLLPMAGQPMIRRVVEGVLAAGFVEVVVVLGHQADEVRAVLEPLGVRTVLNTSFESGQVSSVRTGLGALTQPVDAVMVCLGDQPLVTTADLLAMRAAYQSRPHGSILVPVRGEQRGNPVLLDWQSARETLERGTNFGCRHFMDENPDRVYRWPAPSDGFIRDVDEPADYQTLLRASPPSRPVP